MQKQPKDQVGEAVVVLSNKLASSSRVGRPYGACVGAWGAWGALEGFPTFIAGGYKTAEVSRKPFLGWCAQKSGVRALPFPPYPG